LLSILVSLLLGDDIGSSDFVELDFEGMKRGFIRGSRRRRGEPVDKVAKALDIGIQAGQSSTYTSTYRLITPRRAICWRSAPHSSLPRKACSFSIEGMMIG
jgi:hypothetical protein